MESYLIYMMCRAVLAGFSALPRAVAESLVDVLARLTYRLDRRHRQIALVNLAIAFPSWSDAQRERTALRSFESTGRNLLEVSRMHRLNPANVSMLVSYDERCGMNNLEAARATGKPILYMTGHFSAWELLPTAHALYGQPLTFITRPLDNVYLERHLVKIRERSGNRVISKKNSARQILENLRAYRPVGILVDQNTSLQEGVFADFFGVPAATSTSLALFGLRRDAIVVPGYLTPARLGRYVIKFLAPVELIRTGDMARDIQLNTNRFNQILEGIVREQPESWLWGHKRWKLQPDGRDLYGMSRSELNGYLARNRDRRT